MKKIRWKLCVSLALALLAGCGGQSAGDSSQAEAPRANYIDTIRAARSDSENQAFYVVADPATRESATTSFEREQPEDADSGELFEMPTGDELEELQHGLIFNEANGFSDEPMERYAISLGFSITQAYGIAIVLPKEGQEQAVTDMLNNYVQLQQKAQENYLPDQYAIAKAAVVKTLDGGEVIMVMCENGSQVAADIEAALAG